MPWQLQQRGSSCRSSIPCSCCCCCSRCLVLCGGSGVRSSVRESVFTKNDQGIIALHSRDTTSCCAVALAQHFGQNYRFPQQPRRAWLREARHAILGAKLFGALLRVVLFAVGVFFCKHCCSSNSPLAKKIGAPFLLRRKRFFL